ncbi:MULTISPECIES: hypothetical protein [unclassified Streptomyces]|nr:MULTISPECIES: hypothetical protein [unclassified Streptomyces]
MAATTTVRRARHSARTAQSQDSAIARKNAAAALQRAFDRRDNGGATGH